MNQNHSTKYNSIKLDSYFGKRSDFPARMVKEKCFLSVEKKLMTCTSVRTIPEESR